MSINDPSQIHYIANVRVPGGANNISLDENEVQRYRTDPDGFVAETFGLSKLEYIEWVELDGTPPVRTALKAAIFVEMQQAVCNNQRPRGKRHTESSHALRPGSKLSR